MYQSTGSLITQKAVERAGVNLPTLQPSALGVTLKLLLDIASICHVDNVNRHVAWTFLWRITIHVKLFERHTAQDSLEKRQLKFNVNILEQLYNEMLFKMAEFKVKRYFLFQNSFFFIRKNKSTAAFLQTLVIKCNIFDLQKYNIDPILN